MHKILNLWNANISSEMVEVGKCEYKIKNNTINAVFWEKKNM